ncbi:MAG TPA: hypothetical protein VMK12_24430, partial [Anaeromyxobacteraceae bacterium]|nr:hypothetical protein [Anaeromyxobacteraceae bacterium]
MALDLNPGARFAIFGLLLAAVAGCKGKSISTPKPTADWQGTGTGTVGSAGGIVSLTGGPSIAIPAGALAADTAIVISPVTPTPPSGALTPVYQFEPAGTTFATPITVSFPAPAGTTSAGILWSLAGSDDKFERLTTSVRGTVASAQASHFSLAYEVPGDDTQMPECFSSSYPCRIGETVGPPYLPSCIHNTNEPDGTGCWPP